jgi:hypothetical protein
MRVMTYATFVLARSCLGLIVAMVALHLSLRASISAKRMRGVLKDMIAMRRQLFFDAWRGGLEQAARTIAILAAGAQENKAESATLLRAEEAIHSVIRLMVEAQAKQDEEIKKKEAKVS